MDSYNNSEIPQKVRTPGEEIEMLQTRAQERGRRFGLETPTQEEGEQITSQELTEYAGIPSEKVLDPEFQMQADDIEKRALGLSREGDGKMDELARTLAEKGIKNTLDVVEKLNDPYLSDDFHRFLVQYLAEGMTVYGLKEGTPLFKALHMKLFEVTLPDVTIDGNERDRSNKCV